LNVSSTRLILLHGHAGEVIQTFGQFVLGGNAVVGFVIFLILVVIQFIVITKGSERVSEVAARFTLDAMPGKQMAIDADLNAGLINDTEARQRRSKIQREADFYGAMDGASKFVKGDAIAAIIIIIINVIGGFLVGMLQKNLSALEALDQYTILSVGEGLVAQIPALLISTATGITVTRAASDSNLGKDITKQMFNRPIVLAIAATMVLVLAVLGLPPVPFILLAIILATAAYFINKAQKAKAIEDVEMEKEQEIEEVRKPENVVSLLQVDTMELELGYALIPLVDASQGGDLLDRVVMIRRQCALEMGIVLPPIRMRDNMQLRPNSYVIKIKGVEIAEGELMLDHFLAMSSGLEDDSVQGIDTTEPAFGLPAKWVHSSMREEAELAGYTVVDPPSVVATHLTELIKTHAHEILSRQDVHSLIENVKQNNLTVVEELIPDLMTVGEVQKVLSNLLHERVTIRNLATILEILADYARMTKDIDMLTEYVRQGIARNIIKQVANGSNTLHVITLDPQVEQIIRDSIQQTDHGSYLALDPEQGQRIMNNLNSVIGNVVRMGYQPIVVCPPIVRIYFKRITERMIPNLIVLSYNELDTSIEVQSVGMVNM
jgi:flagellar biosynthesis protein FlhA